MSTLSRGLLAATLTGSLALSGTTVASAADCGSPSAEFTASVDGKEHTFKKVSEFLWQATDDEDVTLNRAEIFQMAKEGADVCSSEPIDIGDWGTGNSDSGSNDNEHEDDDANAGKGGDDADSGKDGDDADSGKGGDDADAGKGGDDADAGKGGDDADAGKGGDDADAGKGGDDADAGKGGDDAGSNEDGDDDKDNDDQNKDKKSSFKDALSSEDGKPSTLGIVAIVGGVLAAIAAAFPFVKDALNIKLPF